MRDMCLKALLPLSATLVLGACGTANMSVYPNNGILPNAALKLSPSVSLTIEEMIGVAAVGAAIYYVYDPLAPNWTIEEKQVDDETYALSLRAKRFRTGGDGEAYQILKRRAVELSRLRGVSGYRILEYTEGVESSTPFTQRVGAGTIRLVRAESVRAGR